MSINPKNIPLSNINLGAELLPQFKANSPKKLDFSMPFLLEQAGIHSMTQAKYRTQVRPSLSIDLHDARINEKPLIADPAVANRFRSSVRNFFMGDLERIDLSNEFLTQPKRSSIHLDLHLLGTGDKGDIFETPSFLFLCQAAEERIKTLDFGYQRQHFHTILPASIVNSNIPLAIRPVISAPREDYQFADAGVIIGLRENPLALEFHPYWDSAALEIGMQHIVDLARDMAKQNTITKAELSGSGKTIFERASAILNLLYQNAVNYTNSHFCNEAIDGISAIHIEKTAKDKYHCKLAVVSIVCEEIHSEYTAAELRAKLRQHRIFEISLARDHYGFLEMAVRASSSRPFYYLDDWPDRINDIN